VSEPSGRPPARQSASIMGLLLLISTHFARRFVVIGSALLCCLAWCGCDDKGPVEWACDPAEHTPSWSWNLDLAMTFDAVWGSSPDDIFAVEYLYDIWGTAPNSVYAVGRGGVILHYDGAAWSPMESGCGQSLWGGVWGSAPDDVYAAGANGTLLHFDGSAWSPIEGLTLEHL